MNKRGVLPIQRSPPIRAVPECNTPNTLMNSDPNPTNLQSPMNSNVNFPTAPPPTRTQIWNTCSRTQTPFPSPQGHNPRGEIHARKVDEDTSIQRNPRSLPHGATARARRNATPASACKRSRADTIAPHTHTGPADHTPRRDQLIPANSPQPAARTQG
ncbi:hypothetical protein AMECASPLE_039323 [Ameca splendens]|uniref:Uncharacterized protein n=1 Tax=Ameca splendens TaxID=208324 RepID=A0ABV0ZJ02_9TELE